MKEIKLTQGKLALVDDEDFERVNIHKWHVTVYKSRRKTKFYASAWINQKHARMPWVVLGKVQPKGLVVDHINGDGLDNRKKNLRICTQAENLHNYGFRNQPNKHSKYKGVTWDVVHKKWLARIRLNKKLIFIGTFTNEKKAALAYDWAAKEKFGEFALTNF